MRLLVLLKRALFLSFFCYVSVCCPCATTQYHVLCKYRGADKSLARPGRKQATATDDFEFLISYL